MRDTPTYTPMQDDDFYLRANHTEECWDLLERDAISDEGLEEDALVARFYDGNATRSPLGMRVVTLLNEGRW